MPRAHRYFTKGWHYHVTHRCHDGSFLLKFAKDRDRYRSMIRERLKGYKISMLGYCLTSNHVHLVLTVPGRDHLAGFMQSLAGDFAQAYNIRKRRSGAFWGDRYHASQIEGGRYLWNCLKYVDLNMVRAGVVSHPGEWPWCSYHELAGFRKRYCLINQGAVFEAFGERISPDDYKENYVAALEQSIIQKDLSRQPIWSESLAVGSERFVREVETTLKNRFQTELMDTVQDNGAWILRESTCEYA